MQALRLGGLKWPPNRLRQRFGLREADLVLSSSAFLTERILRLATPRRLELVHHGIDTDRFSPGAAKQRLALTVCFEITRETAALKGLPTVLEAARSLPDVSFVVVGRSGGDDALEALSEEAPANVSFTDRFVNDTELLELYRRASVYLQLSAHEAFGVAVVEAMACECIPVVSTGHALDEIAGATSRRVPYGDAAAAAAAITSALGADAAEREAARCHVVTRYPIARRVERLAELLDGMLPVS